MITDKEMRAEILIMHNRDRWPGACVAIRDGPMRRALVKAGYLESFRRGFAGRPDGAWRWRLTPLAKATLVNVPGSGVVHKERP